MPNLSLLKSGKVKGIRFDTLEKICEALQCQPGDLLEYRADPPEEDQAWKTRQPRRANCKQLSRLASAFALVRPAGWLCGKCCVQLPPIE